MDTLALALALAAMLGTGAVGGIFFAFSSFVMPALGRLPHEQGLAAMRSINVAVLCASFLATFLGTAVLSLGALVLAGLRWGDPGAALLALGGALYLVGTFLVTGTRNVPLNVALEEDAKEARGARLWTDYLRRWTRWNHVRCAAALLATLAFGLSLVRHAAG